MIILPRRLHANSIVVQQIKNWFNNRRRGTDCAKQGRVDLRLDINEKRKLAPIQAYCSYAWDSTLKPIILTRWAQQKGSTTFDDDDDPPEGDDDSGVASNEGACIPLSFKLKITKELYDGLSTVEKEELDHRREEDRKKLYRTIPQIQEEKERVRKLMTFQRYRSLNYTTNLAN